uniref:Sushi, von Willebrand factor type A, EGF and pentraxin domain containing 1 n=1 Tax=Latimeria chalumnae TaxID=7897 RepID=H3AD23_LATCH
ACPSGTYKPEGGPGGITTCVQCPDQNHISPPGSTSIEDCICKQGYRVIGQACEVVHCPELQPPENGYFIQNVCNNKFNAACGIRCRLGFDLVGSSIRLCQPNGQWSGSQPTCRVRTCSKLHHPENGYINCTTRDTSYRTVCQVTCNEGYRLEGNSKLTCQVNSLWNGKEPRCVEIHCPAFQKPKGIIISPPACGQRPVKPGTICQLSCHHGYSLSGVNNEMQCMIAGKWSANIQKAVCKDIEPPHISCPEDIEAETLEHQNSANIGWLVPTGKDNSGEEVLVQATPAVLSPHLFPIGDVTVTYTATDQSGNRANCSFNIQVIDVEPPVIDRCRSPPPLQTTEMEHIVTWEIPQFSDNSGVPVMVEKTHSPGSVFPRGETVVQYVATDPSGNSRTCKIHIIIRDKMCEIPFSPIHGEFSCRTEEMGVNCTLYCKDGYGFTEEEPVQSYFCAHDGEWRPPFSAEWPDCSLIRLANNGFKSFEMLYKASRCDDINLLETFATRFHNALGKLVPSFCSDDDGDDDIECRVKGLPRGQCLEYNYDYENGFAIGPGGWGTSWGMQNGLDYPYDDPKVMPKEQLVIAESTGASPKTAPLRIKRHKKVNIPMTDQKIQVIFNITASIPLPDSRNDTREATNQDKLLKTLESITNRLKRALNKDPMYTFHFGSEMIFADTKSLESEEASLFCRPGSVLKGRMCVNCPVGTYYSLEHSTCESCWIGSYQDEEGQMECKHCPPGTSTEYIHSRSASECKAQCKPGAYSHNGLETCESCPLGTFQPVYGSKECVSCPENLSTVKRGAIEALECGVPCRAGQFSRSGLIPCYPCPRDYYQPDKGKSYCLSCPFYGTTTITGATSIQDCSSFGSTYAAAEESLVIPVSPENISKKYKISSQVFHECFVNPCQNNGTCEKIGTGYFCICQSGFTGSNCEVDIDECGSGPCQNNALCIDGIGKFACQCHPGYTVGSLCEVNINECSCDPCLNGGMCVDGINSYNCNCATGFIGTHCEIDFDECLSNPCLNSGVCKNLVGEFECVCPLGFSGNKCEMNINECLSQPCLNGATCTDGTNSFRCQCAAGYMGQICETDINECESNPCFNQATCVDALNSYNCKCAPGYKGERCETGNYAEFRPSFHCICILSTVTANPEKFPNHYCYLPTFFKNFITVLYDLPITSTGSNITDLQKYHHSSISIYSWRFNTTIFPQAFRAGHLIPLSWRRSVTILLWKIRVGLNMQGSEVLPGTGRLLLEKGQMKVRLTVNKCSIAVQTVFKTTLKERSPLGVLPSNTSCTAKVVKKGNTPFSRALSSVMLLTIKSITICLLLMGITNSSPAFWKFLLVLDTCSRVNFILENGKKHANNPKFFCMCVGGWGVEFVQVCIRIRCGTPPPLENGFYTAEDFYAGSTIIYQCNNGYYLLGDSRMFCTDNGSWNGIPPSCLDVDECALGSDCDEHATCLNTNGSYICTCIESYTGDGKHCAAPIKCKDPGRPEYGFAEGSMYTVDSEVTFSCEEGYQLIGAAKVTCSESGEWSQPIPYCQAISCGVPSGPLNSVVEASNFTYGNKVVYRCNEGYRLVGEGETICLANGSWSYNFAFCEVVSCPIPQDIMNGKYLLKGTTYMSSVVYTCSDGYRLQGSSTLTCTASGEWDSPTPACKILSCGPPPIVKHSNSTGDNFTFGNTVSYICKEGFTLIGLESTECLANGKWSPSSAQCVPRSCGDPPHVDNAFPESGHRLFGDTAIYFCYDGYSIADNSQLHCNSQGKWAPPDGKEMPHCIAEFCKRPLEVPYTILESINKVKFASGSVVSYKCMEGFVLNTSATIKCMRGGEWKPSPFSIQCIPVRCGEPPGIEQGYMIGTNYSFGAVVAYSCNKGFYIKGEKKRTCEATGEWSGRLPACYPVSCGEPPQIENGAILNKTGTMFGSNVVYQCKPGYKLEGSSGRVCQANRQWYSDSPPSCVLLNCGKPPPLEHGYFKGDSFEVGSTVDIYCDEGYELSGDTTWICQKNGKWSQKQAPVCTPAKCPEPPLFERQLILKEHVNETGIVYLVCREGYILYGAPALKCMSNGLWNDSFPFCELVLCGRLPVVSFGEPSVPSLYFGSTAIYSCMDGFVLKSGSTVTCQADGTWSTPIPECILVECSQPEDIQNGIVDVQGLTYLSTALYTCKPGFELEGNTTILCGEDGHWLGGKPTCKPVQCTRPKEITNGRLSYSELHYGHTVIYLCERGFRLEGQKRLTCLETGKWDADVPSCRAIHCDPPQPIENGFVEGADHSFGAMIIYSCFPGFQITGHAMQTCEEQGWSSFTPLCLPTDCGLPPHIDFGEYIKVKGPENPFKHKKQEDTFKKINQTPSPYSSLNVLSNERKMLPMSEFAEFSEFLYGTMIMYTCFAGHELIGPLMLICQEDGTWNGTSPTCLSIECEPPVAPENGFVNFTDNMLGSAVHYGCNHGYEITGSSTRYCMSSRKWSEFLPVCERVICEPPKNINNGSMVGESYTYQSVIYYKCDPGFILNGSDKRSCQENKQWNGNEPSCIPISCGQPNSPSNGQVGGEDYTFQKQVEYSCNEGFLLEGERSSICLENGSWSGVAPVCRPILCPTPSNVLNGEVIGSEFSYRKEIQYRCREGYVLEGPSKLTCQVDGMWSDKAPHCELVNCGPPEDISHGYLNGSSFNYADSVQYVCFPGYELEGNAIRKCLLSGTWSGIPPSCQLCECSPPSIQNGLAIGKDFSCGGLIKFQCHEGFKLLGPSEVICGTGSRWSSGFPYCGKISCGLPPPIPNAVFNGSSPLYENAVTFSCVAGYIMQRGSELICTEEGLWSEPYPACEPISCGPPPPLPNAEVIGNSYTFGSKVQYRCLEGYVLESETDASVCLQDGSWSLQGIVCGPRMCLLPPNITNLVVTSTEYTVNKTVSLSCAEGYRLSGSNISTCQIDGSWIPSFSDASCTPVSCGKPDPPEHGKVIGTSYNFRDDVLYQCNVGYELQGNVERICQANKLWSGTQPECKKVTCEAPSWLVDGRAEYGNLTVGSRVEYYCDGGYDLEGEQSAECLGNGSWSHPVPLCRPKACPIPSGIPENAVLSETVFYVGQKVSIKCQKGYRLQGQAVINCGTDQNWTRTTAKCEKISCGPPRHVANSLLRGAFYQYGDIVTYSCYSGYMLEGSTRSVCLENGTWTTLPTCKAVCRFPCKNGGVCEGPNSCSCPEGWMGHLCEEPLCILPCLNGGRCIGPYECECPTGWTGARCHIAVCRFSCLNGGKCVRPNRCHCPSAWSGPDCSRKRKPGFYFI